MQHKVNGDEVRQIEGYALLYRQLTTEPALLDVVSDYSIGTINQMVPGCDTDDSFLLTADALQAVIELAYLKGIQDGAPEQPQTIYKCLRCKEDLKYNGAYVTVKDGYDLCPTEDGVRRHIPGII